MSNPLDQLRDNHSDFSKNQESFLFTDPFVAFESWFNVAVSSGEQEANAMVISTVNEFMKPSARVVYLKGLLDQQFVFYTNYLSHKGKDLNQNPNASLLFFWPGLERQIRIEGTVNKISETESDAYFASRPRESQLGAWASHQSEPLVGMDEITQRYRILDEQFQGDIPRPPHWGGMALRPTYLEFWQGKPSRLHERVCFKLTEDAWQISRLNP
ncbi:MAG: pyridoxamine 5'-phosphate oxidase [Crocinitomicaceae bacterium]|jgi:pyridoxamine 5'-phosphate oxidase|nr:pyridoxamine 5'-phosphate oxidase [Cryomorphaceae bacterium]MCF8270054.1 pyridoxamine 5'-phosphate oxidase [Crocinitomicaceae bacterium]